MNVWSFAARNVFRNRRRSLLTAGVVAFGFAAFALAGGFMSQTFRGLKEGTIRGGVGHLQFAKEQTFTGLEDRTLEHGVDREETAAKVLASDPAVAEVLPRIDFVGLVSNGRRSIPYLGVGLDPAPEARAMDTARTVIAGRWLSGPDEAGAVLGTGLAKALQVRPGDSITVFATTPDGVLNALDLTVTGLSDVPIKELDDRYLATTLGAASRLLQVSDRVSKIVVTLKPSANLDAARARLSRSLAATGIALATRDWRQLAVFYGQVKLLYAGIFGFMGGVLVIVVLLACANTMTMAVAERIREIGTLRAIGTPPVRVRRMFVSEGILIAVLGCAVGAGFAVVVRAALNASGIVLPPPPGATHGMPINVELFPVTYAAGLLVMAGTLALASYFPARRASRVPIVEALAHV